MMTADAEKKRGHKVDGRPHLLPRLHLHEIVLHLDHVLPVLGAQGDADDANADLCSEGRVGESAEGDRGAGG